MVELRRDSFYLKAISFKGNIFDVISNFVDAIRILKLRTFFFFFLIFPENVCFREIYIWGCYKDAFDIIYSYADNN